MTRRLSIVALGAGYPLACLLAGTLSGLASWSAEAGMHAMAVAALLAAWFHGRRHDDWPLVGGLFEPALALFFLVLFAGILRSPCGGRSWRLLILWASAAAVFYLVLGSAPGRQVLRWVLPATATAAALLGLAMFALGRTFRVAAPLGHHNYMAGFLLLHWPLTFEAAAQARSPALRWSWRAAAALQAVALLFTGSLAGIAVGAALALRQGAGSARMLRWPPPRFLRLAAIALLVLLGGLLAASYRGAALAQLARRATGILVERHDPSLSLENRVRFLRAGAAMWLAHPLAGFGLGSVPLSASLYRAQTPGLSAPGEVIPQLHDLPVNLLAETGALGLAAALLLVLSAASSRPGAATAALWAYLVFAISDYQLDLPAILFPFAVLAALAAGDSAEKAEPALFPRWLALASAFLAGVAAIGLLGASSVAHYHYARGDFSRAARWDQDCGFYAFEQGARAQEGGREHDARNAFLLAAQQMPDLVPAAAQAGSSLARAGLFDQALPWLERAAALDYYFTAAHFHLGRARLRGGDRAGAIEAFATSLLVQPATVFAEDWRSPPERDVYAASLERAIERLYELAAFYPRSGPWRRWNELGAYLIGRRNRLPEGPYRVVLFELLDRDLAVNQSLIVFRRTALPVRVAPVVLFSPTPAPHPPAGLGVITGLPSVRALDLLARER